MERFGRNLEVSVKNPRCEMLCSSVTHTWLTRSRLCAVVLDLNWRETVFLHGLCLEYGGWKKTVLTGTLIFTVKNTVVTVVLNEIHIYG